MLRDCSPSSFAVFKLRRYLCPSRPRSLRPTTARTRSVRCKSSQSCTSSASQSEICCGTQSRATDIASAIRQTRTDKPFHASLSRKPAAEPTGTPAAIRRRSTDDPWRLIPPADRVRPIPSRCYVSTRSTYRVRRHTPAPTSSSRASSSLPAGALYDAATHPPAVGEQHDGRRIRYADAVQSNGAMQKLDEQIPAGGHRLRPTHDWPHSKVTASAALSQGHGNIKLNALFCAGFRQRAGDSSTKERSPLSGGIAFPAHRACWLRCCPKA